MRGGGGGGASTCLRDEEVKSSKSVGVRGCKGDG